MTKRLFAIFLSSVLVVLLCVTGSYATDLSGYFSTKNWGNNPSSTLTFSENGFSISCVGTSYNMEVGPTNNISSMSGSVEVTLDQRGDPNTYIFFTGNSYIVSSSITNTVGCTVSANGRSVYPVSGSTYCSFDFSVSYSTPTTYPRFASNNDSVSFPTSAQWTFTSLSIDGNEIISGVIGENVGFSIPAGYALVIDGPCEILERSYYINNSWNFYKNGNLRINGAFEKSLSSTYIRDGYSPDMALTFDQLVQWEAMNVNIVGSASDYESYSSEIVSITDGSCYVIGYPTLFGTGDENSRLLYTNAVDMVCGLYMTYTNRPSFRFVAIESLSSYRNDGTFYTYSAFRPAIADVEGSPSEGSGGVVITPDSSLPSGGGNTGQPPVDEDGSLLGTISRFVNDIKRLLSSAVEAINTLVNDGSSFMQSIGTMFSWLPAPLTSLIIAGFTVLLVVGVLKVLWR